MGVEKEISITRPETCSICHGSGARPGTSVTKCPTCNGTGTVRQVQNTILGQMQTTRTCTACHGTGEVIKEPCDNCKGKGTVRKQAKIKVKIPAGIFKVAPKLACVIVIGTSHITVVVQTPKRLNKEQRDLLEKLAKTMNEQPPIKKRGLFG